jgi:hypothetical protein
LKHTILEVTLSGPHEWEEFKQQEIGTTEAVSDSDYLNYRKRRAREWRKKMDG